MLFMALGVYQTSTPEGKARISARDAISKCRKQLADQMHGSSVAHFVRGTCEKMEADFVREFGGSP